MPPEHDAPRFSPEQSARLLDLATRLEAQHQSTVGVEELVRAAEEAGIDPRFVRQAAAILPTHESAAAPYLRPGLGALSAFGLALFALGSIPSMPFVQQRFPGTAVLALIATVAALGGYTLGRQGAPGWVPPALGTLAFLLGIQAMGALMRSVGFYRYDAPYGLFLLVALVSGAAAALARRPAPPYS